MGTNDSAYTSGSSIEPLVALFGKVRRTILSILFSRPEEDFYVRELARMVDGGQGGVQRELNRLFEAGLVQRRRRGRQLFYRANRESPLFAALLQLVEPSKQKSSSGVEGKKLETEALSWLRQQKPYIG